MIKSKIIEHIREISRNITILDVGARDGLGWPWTDLNKNYVNAILVEPDPEEAKSIQNKLNQNQDATVLPIGLWDKTATLKLNLILSVNYTNLNINLRRAS